MTTQSPQQLGMIGLGRMGANIVRRLLRDGHSCVVHDVDPGAVAALAVEGAIGADTLPEFIAALARPRTVWVMVPAAHVGAVVAEVAGLLEPGDVIIDGGNSYYRDDITRAAELAERGLHFVDVGTSGGVYGLERGYCLMIGGETDVVTSLDPIFAALAPGVATASPTPGRAGSGTAAEGYLHCGPNGAGHFVKMVHNGIEYAMMAALAEGLNILDHADVGLHQQDADAETTPLRDPAAYSYDIDVAEVTEVWRRGSVISSWLLDLTAAALASQPDLAGFSGRVSDSGEGRWTVQAAIDTATPAPVITAALFDRFTSRGEAEFENRILSAMRYAFGGHLEKPE